MRVIDPGHKYALAHLDGTGETIIDFVKREGPAYPGNMGRCEGTNIQENLRALIDRVKYLDKQEHCTVNVQLLQGFRFFIRLLEERAALHHGRQSSSLLYGVNIPAWRGWETNPEIENVPTCLKCGHIGCLGTCHQAVPDKPVCQRCDGARYIEVEVGTAKGGHPIPCPDCTGQPAAQESGGAR
jgi:hypothetical protein